MVGYPQEKDIKELLMRVFFEGGNQIKIGAMLSYFTIAMNIVLGLLYTPWMVSKIGQSDFGILSLALSIIAFFAMDFGLGPAVSRFLAKYRALGDKDGARKFLGISFKIFAMVSLIIFVALFIVYFFIESMYFQLSLQEIAKLKNVFIITAMFTVISFPFKPFDGILLTYERFIFVKTLDLILKITNILITVCVLFLGYGIYSIALIHVFIGLLKLGMQYFYIVKNTDAQIDFSSFDMSLIKEILGFSSWTTVIAVSQRFILTVSPTIIAMYAGSSEIAIFSIGTAVEGYIWTISTALGGMFLPKVMRMTSENNWKAIEDLQIKVGRIQLIIVGFIITTFIVMGKEFIQLWMGNDFANSYLVAVFLTTTGFVTLTQDIAYTALVAKNEIKYRAAASLLAALLSLSISFYLTPAYGSIGAATAIFIGNFVGLVLFMNVIYQKVLKLNIIKFFKECHWPILSPLLLIALIGFCFQYFIPVQSLMFFFIKVILLTFIYMILIWLLTLNHYEKSLFASTIKNPRGI